MTYLTNDEQIEISMMEKLFDSEAYKIFLSRTASPDHVAQLQAQYSSASDMRQLGFLQGQERVIKQIMEYAATYQATIEAIEEQRGDDAKIVGIEREEGKLANA